MTTKVGNAQQQSR